MRPNNGALRYFGCIKNGTTPASDETEYWDGDMLWATPEDLGKLSGDRISQTKRQITSKAVEESNLSVLPTGSVIISTRAPIGHMAMNNVPMAFNQGCRGIIPGDRVHGPFLYYLLKSRAPELNAMANGTTFVELSRNELAAVPVEFPPLDTQRRIAQFLDEKTARIDGLVARKERLLELLAEKRQALITLAVTGQLDRDQGRYSNAGKRDRIAVEEVGLVSEPIWKTWKLAHAYPRIGSGTTPTSSEERYYNSDTGVPWVTTAELRESYIDDTQTHVTEDALKDFSALRLYGTGSLLIAMYGATIGRLGIINIEATCNQACCVFERSDQFDNRFVFYWLWHRRADLIALSVGGGQPNLSQKDLREERAPCPPLDIQRDIAEFLDERTARIDELIAKNECLLELLAEKRQALITCAVTGQLDIEAV